MGITNVISLLGAIAILPVRHDHYDRWTGKKLSTDG